MKPKPVTMENPYCAKCAERIPHPMTEPVRESKGISTTTIVYFALFVTLFSIVGLIAMNF